MSSLRPMTMDLVLLPLYTKRAGFSSAESASAWAKRPFSRFFIDFPTGLCYIHEGGTPAVRRPAGGGGAVRFSGRAGMRGRGSPDAPYIMTEIRKKQVWSIGPKESSEAEP